MASLLGGLTEGREYVLKIVADVKDAVSGVDQVAAKTTTMKDKMVGVGKAVATGIAVAGVVQFGKDVLQAGQDADAGMDLVENVFGSASKSVIDFSQTVAESMGMSAAQYQQMAGKTGQVLTQMGISQADAAKSSEVLGQRAADMAALFGGDASQAMEAFDKAMMGQTKGLKQYGIQIDKTEVEARAMAKGYTDASGEVTDAGRAIATQELILEKTAKQAGAFADNSKDLGSQQQILAAKFDNVQQKLGTALLPVIEKLMDLMGPLIDIFAKYANILVPLALGIGAIVIAVKLWNAAQLILNATLWTNPIFLVVAAIAGLIAIIVIAYNKVDWFRNAVDAMGRAAVDAFNWVKDAAVTAFNWIKENWPLLIAILTGPFGTAAYLVIKHWDSVKDFFFRLPGYIYDFFKQVYDFLIGPFVRAAEYITRIWNGVYDWFYLLPGKIQSAFAGLGDIIAKPFKDAWHWFEDSFGKVLNWFYELPGKISGFFGTLANIISWPFEQAFKAIKWSWNHTVGGFHWKMPWFMGGMDFKIPEMAKGGIVNKPTIALIGEAGPEAVIPLSSMGTGAPATTQTVNINVYALTANAEVGRKVYEALAEFERINGRRFLTA